MRLTARQERFVAEYAAKRNGAAAARAAGYAHSSAKVTASRLLTKANLRKALEGYERQARRFLGTSREQVLVEIQKAIETARMLDQPMTAIAGWREIAKICGYYKERPERAESLSADGRRILADIHAMSDDELMRRAGIQT